MRAILKALRTPRPRVVEPALDLPLFRQLLSPAKLADLRRHFRRTVPHPPVALTVRQLAERVHGRAVTRAELVSVRRALLGLAAAGQVWPVDGPGRDRRWALPVTARAVWRGQAFGAFRAEVVRSRRARGLPVHEW